MYVKEEHEQSMTFLNHPWFGRKTQETASLGTHTVSGLTSFGIVVPRLVGVRLLNEQGQGQGVSTPYDRTIWQSKSCWKPVGGV